jgi:CubicO group peptidase (beta-lactamase class C family)
MISATLLYVLDSTTNSSHPLSMDTKVHKIIPSDFVLTDDYATLHATLKNVLSHQLGYPPHDASYGEQHMTAVEVVRRLRHLPMRKELREEFQYFNIRFTIAQHVIQVLTGKWVGDVQKESIFEPLGMASSTVLLSEALEMKNTLAYGYSWDNISKSLVKQPWWDGLLVGPGGLMTSSMTTPSTSEP